MKKKMNLSSVTEKRLYVYLSIVILCALATLANLFMEKVGFHSLSSGSTDEVYLFLLSIGIVIVCGISVVFLVLAIRQKREEQKLEEERIAKKKANKLAKKQAKNRK